VSRKPVTLWRPDEPETQRNYHTCNKALCVNPVNKPGEICVDHQAEAHMSRSPNNLLAF